MALRRMDAVSLGIIAMTSAVTAAVYPRLPEQVATHFDLAGNANGWMSRPMAASFVPALALGTWALLRILPRALPKSEQQRLGGAISALVAALIVGFIAAAHLLVLYRAIVPTASVSGGMCGLLGAMYVALGLVLPRVKRNALIGIRTPWTLTSDENWARTQRVGGYAFVTSGILAVLLGVFGGPRAGVPLLILLLGGAFVPAAYSLLLARRQDQGS